MAMVVEIETDTGLIGWGGCHGPAQITAAVVGSVAAPLDRRGSASGARRAKAALSSGCKPHPATAPAGSNRSSHGGNEVAEAFD